MSLLNKKVMVDGRIGQVVCVTDTVVHIEFEDKTCLATTNLDKYNWYIVASHVETPDMTFTAYHTPGWDK